MTSETAFYSLFRCIRRSRCRTAMHSIATRTSPSVSVRSRPGSHERAMTPVMSSVPLSSNIINFFTHLSLLFMPRCIAERTSARRSIFSRRTA